MSRQKYTSGLLVFALAGVTAMAGCMGQQRTVRSSQVRTDQQRTSQMRSDQKRPSTDQKRPTTTQRRPSTKQQRAAAAPPAAAPAPMPRPRSSWPTMSSSGDMVCSAMAYPTGDARTSAVGIEKCVPREVRQNAPFTYDIIVTNLTPNPLEQVVVTDQPENGLRITGSTPTGQGSGSGLHTWPLGTLGPRESKTIRVNAVAPNEGTVGSCATVSYASNLCSTIPVVTPRLRLTKTGPSEVLSCDEIVYQFEVANTGTGTVRNVRIDDPLPAGLMAAAGGGRTLSFDAGSIAPGESKRFTGRAKAERGGRFENRATATAEGDLSVESGVVSTVVRKPQLTISKNCVGTQYIGKAISYEITVTNTGDGEARDVVIEDAIANGLRFVSASDGGRHAAGKVTWNAGTLAPRGTKTVTMRAEPTGAGTFRNTATARAYCADPVTDSCQTAVTGIPAILLEVVDVEDPVRVGENETYVITVTNQGSAADTNITIVCTLESNQQYVSSSGDTRGTASGQTVTFEPLRTLAPKAKATFRVVVKALRAGDVRFKVSMDTEQLTRPVEETESTHLYE